MKWQQRWNRNTNNKLFQVKPFWGEWRSAFRKSRKEQQTDALFYTRARTATTVLDMPNALHKHVLLECKVFNDTRKHYFHANTKKDLFENVHMDNV